MVHTVPVSFLRAEGGWTVFLEQTFVHGPEIFVHRSGTCFLREDTFVHRTETLEFFFANIISCVSHLELCF